VFLLKEHQKISWWLDTVPGLIYNGSNEFSKGQMHKFGNGTHRGFLYIVICYITVENI